MTNVTLDRVWEEIKTLTPDEQRQLKELLNVLSEKLHSPPTEEEFERMLLEEGIISEIPPPITDFTPYRNRKPAEIKGKPLSEVIIEERR